jgi:hypothetical protein
MTQKLRKLKNLIKTFDQYAHGKLKSNDDLIKYLNDYIYPKLDKQTIRRYKLLVLKGKKNKYKPIDKNFLAIKNLVLELKITTNDYIRISTESYHYKAEIKNTAKETRDNKGVYVGSGGSNGTSVRYPKKNRSKRVWKIFYEMFPHKAEKDGYNGKKSKRMKKK